MKIFLVIGLLFTASCTSLGEFAYKVDFQNRISDYTFDSDLALRKTNEKVNYVELIKVEEIKDLPGTLARMAVDLEGYAITQHIKFSTDEEFYVFEDILKDYAKSKGAKVVVYVVAKDVLRYNLYNDNKTLKIIERKGNMLFNAFLFSKVQLDRSRKIQLDQ
jgi:hypothetical protein